MDSMVCNTGHPLLSRTTKNCMVVIGKPLNFVIWTDNFQLHTPHFYHWYFTCYATSPPMANKRHVQGTIIYHKWVDALARNPLPSVMFNPVTLHLSCNQGARSAGYPCDVYPNQLLTCEPNLRMLGKCECEAPISRVVDWVQHSCAQLYRNTPYWNQ